MQHTGAQHMSAQWAATHTGDLSARTITQRYAHATDTRTAGHSTCQHSGVQKIHALHQPEHTLPSLCMQHTGAQHMSAQWAATHTGDLSARTITQRYAHATDTRTAGHSTCQHGGSQHIQALRQPGTDTPKFAHATHRRTAAHSTCQHGGWQHIQAICQPRQALPSLRMQQIHAQHMSSQWGATHAAALSERMKQLLFQSE